VGQSGDHLFIIFVILNQITCKPEQRCCRKNISFLIFHVVHIKQALTILVTAFLLLLIHKPTTHSKPPRTFLFKIADNSAHMILTTSHEKNK
jgi:hypothetical protein